MMIGVRMLRQCDLQDFIVELYCDNSGSEFPAAIQTVQSRPAKVFGKRTGNFVIRPANAGIVFLHF